MNSQHIKVEFGRQFLVAASTTFILTYLLTYLLTYSMVQDII